MHSNRIPGRLDVRISRTIRTVFIGSIENSVYGHDKILAESAGLPSSARLNGRLQHGWVPAEKSRSSYKNCLVDSFVWNLHSEITAKSLGWQNTQAIGAPWLYFLRNLNSRNLTNAMEESIPTFDELWIYSRHSVEISKSDKGNLLNFLKSANESVSPRKAVLLYYTDFFSLSKDELSAYKNIHIFTLSNARIWTHSSDGLYFSIYFILKNTKKIITERVSSILLYAITLNIPIEILEERSNSLIYRSVLEHPNQLSSLGVTLTRESSNLIEFVNFELGLECMLSSQELRNLFIYTVSGIRGYKIIKFIKNLLNFPRNVYLSLRSSRDLARGIVKKT